MDSSTSMDLNQDGPMYPSDLIDPAKKDKEWYLRWVKAAYQEHRANRGHFNSERRQDWIEDRLYAQGNQSTTKYVNWLSKSKNAKGQKVGYMDLDWSIVSIVPKFRDVVLGYLEKIEYDIHADAVNPEAVDQKTLMKHKIWAQKKLKAFGDKIDEMAGKKLGGGVELPFMPETKEEVELFASISMRLKDEIALEMSADDQLYQNKWQESAKLMREDAFDLGVIGCEVVTDPVTRDIKINYWDPVNMIIDDFRGHDYTGKKIGHIEPRTIAQIKQEAGSQFTEKEYQDIANRQAGQNNNSTQTYDIYNDYINTDNDYRDYDQYNCLVVNLYWFGSNQILHEKKEAENGETYIFEKPYGTKVGTKSRKKGDVILKSEIFPTDIKTVHGAKWIVGTDYIYNYGLVYDIARPSDNPKECSLPGKFYRITSKSILERMLPHADAIQLSWLKIQNAKAKARPKGLKIQIGALENVEIDGKKIPAMQLLEIANQTGNIIYRNMAVAEDEDSDSYGSPVEELEGGMGNEFVELVNDLNNNIQLIREVSGVNELMDASTPAERQAVGTAKMALQGSHNALYPMISGFVSVKEQVVTDIIIKTQILVQYGEIEGVVRRIGEPLAQTYKVHESAGALVLAIQIKRRPTEEQKQEIKQAAREALAITNNGMPGGIEFPDYLYIIRICDTGNIKLAEAVLTYRLNFKKRQDQKASEKNAAQQNQAIQEQIQVGEQSKVQSKAMMTDEDMRRDKGKAVNDIKVNKSKLGNDMVLKEMEAEIQSSALKK